MIQKGEKEMSRSLSPTLAAGLAVFFLEGRAPAIAEDLSANKPSLFMPLPDDVPTPDGMTMCPKLK